MSKITERIKNWISPSFQLITIGLLITLLLLVIKQQREIDYLYSTIDDTESRLSSEIDDAKDDLSSEIYDLKSDIEDVRRAVIIYGN
jgi:hypothetical protein